MLERINEIKIGTDLRDLYNELNAIIEEIIPTRDVKLVVETGIIVDALDSLNENDVFVKKLVHSGKEKQFEPIKNIERVQLFSADLNSIEKGASNCTLVTSLYTTLNNTYVTIEIDNGFYWVLEADVMETVKIPYYGIIGEA